MRNRTILTLTIVALAVVATPGAHATHSGYLQLSHNNTQLGPAVTNWYNGADTPYTLGIGAASGDGRVALNAIGITARSFDHDPALYATNPSGLAANAIEAQTVNTGGSAIWAHHDGSSAPSYGVAGTSAAGTGVYGSGAENGVFGETSNTAGVGVTARNTSGVGLALRVLGKSYLSGSVGVGTQAPVSKLQVVGNYLQLPTRTVAPPATDCDEAKEAGRLVVRVAATAPNLYICRGTAGWRGL